MTLFKQHHDYDCGPACIKMLVDHFGIKHPNGSTISYRYIKRLCRCTKDGTEFRDFNNALKHFGFKRRRMSLNSYYSKKNAFVALIEDPEEPSEDHYVVLTPTSSGYLFGQTFDIIDPYYGVNNKFPVVIRSFNSKPWVWEIYQ